MPLQFFRVKQHLTELFTQLAVKKLENPAKRNNPYVELYKM